MSVSEWANLLIGVATAVGVAYAILQGVIAIRLDSRWRNTEFISSLNKELVEIKRVEAELVRTLSSPTAEDRIRCYRYASDYLNLLERVAFFANAGCIDKRLLVFLRHEVAYGLKLHNWKVQMGYISEAAYPSLVQYAKVENITVLEDESDFPDQISQLLREHRVEATSAVRRQRK